MTKIESKYEPVQHKQKFHMDWIKKKINKLNKVKQDLRDSYIPK